MALKLNDIIKYLGNIFEKNKKNAVSLNNDAALSSDLQILKIGEEETPIEVSTTSVKIANNDITDINRYFYHTQIVGFYSSATSFYLPMTGYIVEQASATGRNEYLCWVAPYDGFLERITYRSEAAQDGDLQVELITATAGTENPATNVGTCVTTIDIADDIAVVQDWTNANLSGSSARNLVKGQIYNIKVTTPSNGLDTNVTVVLKYDLTT